MSKGAANAVSWQDANAAFLKAVVAMLRAHLAALAESDEPAGELSWPQHPAKQPLPALLMLREVFDLSPFETAVLALCAAFELDTGIGPLCAAAAGEPGRPWPSVALALRAFPAASWEAISPAGPLRFWYLIRLNQHAAEPMALAGLHCDTRILDFIKGLNCIDERLAQLAVEVPAMPAEAADQSLADTLAALWSEYPAKQGAVMLYGADAPLRLGTARMAAGTAERRLYRVDAEALATAPAESDQLVRLWNREALLTPLALAIDVTGLEDGAISQLMRRLIGRLAFPVALLAEHCPPRRPEALLPLAVGRPDREVQKRLWQEILPTRGKRGLADRLSANFDFTPAAIAQLAAAVPEGGDDKDVWHRCVVSVRPRLDALAQRIEPRAGWDDLVLPADQEAMLHQMVDQVRQRRLVYDDWGYAKRMSRGLGINALFTGESGTGKTLAAEVIATELAINLYRIDLSAVVSKYIGETEKNLRQLFDAAEQGGAVLFFDEADALFGKRSEIKDSHDRYANIEVNYLLQRIETFSGLAILATNMKAALDTAFMRRLRFIVRFPHPGPEERQRLWQRAFPKDVPLEPLDYGRLGRINLTGGHIAAAALNATFLAASAKRSVTMADVLQAARAEMVKLSRPIAEADFAVPIAGATS